MTGNKNMTPHEPWDEIEKETLSGRTKTFNWFCDDTWRFESFTKEVCNKFTVCSTPEPKYVQKYKDIGYSNVIVGPWHANIDFYPNIVNKDIDASFCGVPNEDRAKYAQLLKDHEVNFNYYYRLSHEDMMLAYSRSKIGLNFSKNMNGQEVKTQMKARMFEVPAAKTLLLTEYTDGIEEFFEIDKEIVCFSNPEELLEKIQHLLQNPGLINAIADNGYQRFLKEHESHVRLKNVLEGIELK
jgi:spore maturation protein CgeB